MRCGMFIVVAGQKVESMTLSAAQQGAALDGDSAALHPRQ